MWTLDIQSYLVSCFFFEPPPPTSPKVRPFFGFKQKHRVLVTRYDPGGLLEVVKGWKNGNLSSLRLRRPRWIVPAPRVPRYHVSMRTLPQTPSQARCPRFTCRCCVQRNSGCFRKNGGEGGFLGHIQVGSSNFECGDRLRTHIYIYINTVNMEVNAWDISTNILQIELLS